MEYSYSSHISAGTRGVIITVSNGSWFTFFFSEISYNVRQRRQQLLLHDCAYNVKAVVINRSNCQGEIKVQKLVRI